MVKYIHDYYKILGVEVDATEDEIKKAYKRAVLEYHPDVNNQDNANSKFGLIHDAYVVLSDEKKREKYDRLREVALKKNQIVERKSAITKAENHSKSKSLDTISKGVELVGTLENEVGLFSNLINVFSGSNSGKFNKSGSSKRRYSGCAGRRRRRRGEF